MGSGSFTPSTLGNFALGARAGGALLGAFGQIQEGQAASQAAKYQAQVAKNNAALAVAQGQEIERRAEFNARLAIEKGQHVQFSKAVEYRKMIGRQKVQLAANGVLVDQDSALAITDETQALASLDQEMIAHNAELEAHAIRTGAMDQVAALDMQALNFNSQAALLRSQAGHATQASFIGAGSTLLEGGFGVASQAFNFQQQGIDTLLS